MVGRYSLMVRGDYAPSRCLKSKQPNSLEKIMADSLMYEEDHFVLLIPGKEEEILTVEELRTWLAGVLGDRQNNLPRDLMKFPTTTEQANYLLNTACEFELQPGKTIQWYAIRLEK